MRKVVFGCLLMLTAALCFVPVGASEHEEGEKKISVHGEVRARWEYLENMTDFTETGTTDPGGDNDDFDFWPYRVRLGVKGEFSDNVSAYVEVQNFGALGDTFPYPGNSADDPVAQSAPLSIGTNETDLYQAYVDLKEIGGSLLSLRIGRQEHTLGNELHIGDFDFYNGMTFDGLRGMLDFETWDMDFFYYNVAERNVVPGSTITGPGGEVLLNGGSDDAIFWGVTADFGIGDSGQAIEPYVLYYREGNETGNIATLMPKHNTLTFGALWDRPASDDSAFDWSLEFAMQQGDFDSDSDGDAEADIAAWIAEGWFGWSFGSGHRVHIGALVQSDGNDSCDANGDCEFFIPLFTDLHSNNRLGDSDLIANFTGNPFVLNSFGLNTFHNITNYNIGYDWSGGDHHFMAAYHVFQRTEDFGNPNDELGDEWNLGYDYDYSHNLAFQFGLALFAPGDFFESIDPIEFQDDAMRFWGQARLRF